MIRSTTASPEALLFTTISPQRRSFAFNVLFANQNPVDSVYYSVFSADLSQGWSKISFPVCSVRPLPIHNVASKLCVLKAVLFVVYKRSTKNGTLHFVIQLHQTIRFFFPFVLNWRRSLAL